MAPRISIVMIFLDEVVHLREAVDSVHAQTFRDWELLLVDDGSTDGSGELARSLVEQDPVRIRYLTHPGGANRGMSASRNLGIAQAQGREVAFLDADDVYLPGKLTHQAALLEACPEVAMVYGPMTLWHSWEQAEPEPERGRDRVRPTGLPPGRAVPAPEAALAWLRGAANPPATCSVLLRRDAALRVGGFEERFRGMYEDQAFFVKLALTERVLPDDVPLDLYRQHPASASQLALAAGSWRRRERNPAELAFLSWLDEHVRRHGPATVEVRRALRRALLPYRHPRADTGLRLAARVARVAGLSRRGR